MLLASEIPTQWAILTLQNGLTFSGYIELVDGAVDVRIGEPVRGRLTLPLARLRSVRSCALGDIIEPEVCGSDVSRFTGHPTPQSHKTRETVTLIPDISPKRSADCESRRARDDRR